MTHPDDHLRVLVVEDDARAADLLRRVIVELGHECDAVTDGRQAWDRLGGGDFDVVVSDWQMPEMDGLELCRRVRATDRPTYLYFIFVTALGDRAHFAEGTKAGADDFLGKPIDIDELEARLASASRVLALHRRLAANNVQLRHDSDRAHASARSDALTGAANRLAMTEDLEEVLAGAAADGPRCCAALCDVNHFKAYNDRCGHLGGDEALRRVAVTIRGALRRGDALYRYGGEEFLVLLPAQTLEEARGAMERVRVAVERETDVTISVGVDELVPAHDRQWEPWIARADAALYAAKGGGRNRVEPSGGRRAPPFRAPRSEASPESFLLHPNGAAR